MTTASPTAGAAAPESARDQAIQTLKELAYDVLLAASEPLKTVDVARGVLERAGPALRLPAGDGEDAAGSFAGLVRLVLDSDPAFYHENRQWQLAGRRSREDADRRRPVERAIEDALQSVGRPLLPNEVSPLVAAVYGRTPEYYEGMVRRLAVSHPRFFVAAGERVGLTSWLIDTEAGGPADVALDNFDEDAEWQAFLPEAMPEAERPVDLAVALIEAAGRPVPSRALLYLVWSQFQDSEPQALFNNLLSEPRVALGHGPVWMARPVATAKLAAMADLTRDPDLAASMIAEAQPAVEEEVAPAARVSETDLEQIYNYMNADLRSFRLTELCQEVLESFPGSRTFAAVRDSLEEQIRSDPRFIWVGTERFRLDGTLPDEVEQVPEGLTADEKAYADEDAGFVDEVIPLDRWRPGLEEQILHPLVQELGDDVSVTPAQVPTSVRVTPPLHHYLVGTFYLRNEQRGLLPPTPELVEVTLLLPDGGRQDVWLNNRLGLVYGLKEWYDANLPWTGGAFKLEAGGTPDEFRLLYSGEREPLLDLPTERLQELLLLRGQAEADEITLGEILMRLLRRHPQGVPFVTLFTEVNIVRRSSRALVASVLSSHRGFQTRGDAEGTWYYDEKRAEKSKKSKRPKRFHEVEEDEEELDV
jgi:hypothetical protein